MRPTKLFVLASVLLACGAMLVFAASDKAAKPTPWSINATAIEACSCPMFCQCYFNTKPAGHHSAHAGHAGHAGHGEHAEGEGGTHFCRANLAYKVNRGRYGDVKLDGAKFWIVSDLGGDFTKGMDWAVLYFDKSMTPGQREAIEAIWPHVFPVQWKSFKTAEGVVDRWEFDRDSAYATLDGGKTAEVKLKRFPGMTDEPIVIRNLQYWGAPRNDGFVLMPNEVQAYRVGENAFEFHGTNGFLITIDMNSKDVEKAAAGHGM